MSRPVQKITIGQWDALYAAAPRRTDRPSFDGPPGRHLADGDRRLRQLFFDNSDASLDLWNFLLTEEARLQEARKRGDIIIGTMKDLGTVPILAYALPGVRAFYPDGAWWLPCILEHDTNTLSIADSLGMDESFCPVRAMLGAFVNCEHFPLPDLLVCSTGATCDDFAAIARRVESLGHTILWWDMPHRPDNPTPCSAHHRRLVAHVAGELRRVAAAIEQVSGRTITDARLRTAIRSANRIRTDLRALRETCFGARIAPLPALELLIAEMLIIHYCSDRRAAGRVIRGLLSVVRQRIHMGQGHGKPDAPRIFWVNPVADLRIMNLLEDCGGVLCGTDNMFLHSLDPIREDINGFEALAICALSDPMVGSAGERAARICLDARRFGAEAIVVSRIPGASHCATEGAVIAARASETLGIPVLEIEVPPVSDPLRAALTTRLQALVETCINRRSS